MSEPGKVYHHDLSHGSDGRRYWRSLDELAQTPEFIERLHREFPMAASEFEDTPDGMSRRNFLSLMSASLALAGLAGAGCTRQPTEKIVPYVNKPEEILPGRPLYFATSITLDGYAHGAIVQSHEGRPTKVEGNPDHPASLGATNVFMQASVLSLYDPNRSQAVVHIDDVSTWNNFLDELRPALKRKQEARGGAGLRVLSPPVTSPTLAGQILEMKKRFPQAQWHYYSPTDRANVRAGTMLACGFARNVVYQFDRAETIVSLDSDFLTDEPGSLRYARQFIDHRRVRKERTEMNRLYVFESTRSITGATADHRRPVLPDQIASITSALATVLGIAPIGLSRSEASSMPVPGDFLAAVVQDLRRAGRGALVLAGPSQPPAVHATCHAINSALGSAGNTVYFTEAIEYDPPAPDSTSSLAALVNDMNAGAVDTLFILSGNPVYDAPVDLDFTGAMQKVALRFRLGLYEDETSEQCHWHLPMTHELEQWGDGRAFDGTISIVQPLIAPLYQPCRSVHELVSILLDDIGRPAYDIIRDSWRRRFRGQDFEAFWTKSLHDGLMENTASPRLPMNLRARPTTTTIAPTTFFAPDVPSGLRIIFRPDPTVGDGSWAGNAWLQELPKPITRLTWDNAALISPATARTLNLENEDRVELRHGGRSVQAGVWIVPGLPDDCVNVTLGYGRARIGHGFNAYAIRTSEAPWFSSGAELVSTGGKYPLAATQHEQLMHGRDLVRVQDIAPFRAGHEPSGHGEARKHSLTLYQPWEYDKLSKNQWGMVIDNNACIGCNACVIACVAENNIPVVGKEQVAKGRAMHWLRIDTYFASAEEHHEGEFKYHDHAAENPETYFQPVPCMHCENAPCELVCPVGATVHDNEGTNNMVYNRCIGTRYCSNNCPYKVRRFNWFEFNGNVSPSQSLGKNPDVTVRSRGVMEKCTYCIQRINRARIEAKKDPARGDGFVRDGEVETACQQACPTQAILFGNISDRTAAVTKAKEQPTNYGLLEELNTQPRTTYLTRFRNPNPAIKA